MSDQDTPKKIDPKVAKGCGIGCLGLIVIVIVAVIVGSVGGGSDDQSGQVKVACQGWVKDRLKAPSTADFSDETVSRDGDTYTVRGAVDAQNAFGAMIRNTYTCVATHSGDSTTLVSLTGLSN